MGFGSDFSSQRVEYSAPADTPHSNYFWKATPVGGGAQIVTLFCRSCKSAGEDHLDVPLVAVLRDTLGDDRVENDRLRYVWLLSYVRPTIGQRALSAVPFFYWRVGGGSRSPRSQDEPLIDISQPKPPVINAVGRSVLQWAVFDTMISPVRASSRAYRTNELDQERLHLEEAISYIRDAPAGNDSQSLSRSELNTVLARLALRKRMLGGLVSEQRAEQVGGEDSGEQEVMRSRNWEMLRECAEKTGLVFEPLNVAGNRGQYAIVWFAPEEPFVPPASPLGPIFKLMNISDPRKDRNLEHWKGPVFVRSVDENWTLLPAGETSVRPVRLIPLGVYSMNYPKLPLLLIDFRDKLHPRRREMAQRTIQDLTLGVLGLSHFTNWYFFAGQAAYEFVIARHGAATDRVGRLDCYSQFRMQLALDRSLNPALRGEMQRRVASLAVNPLETAPDVEVQIAEARYQQLLSESQENGALQARLEKDRRAELAAFGESSQGQWKQIILHDLSFGAYTHRAKPDETNTAVLHKNRRIQYNMAFLDSLVDAGTDPTIPYSSKRVQDSVNEMKSLMPEIAVPEVRAHALATLDQLHHISHDPGVQEDCLRAILEIRNGRRPVVALANPSGLAAQSTPVPTLSTAIAGTR